MGKYARQKKKCKAMGEIQVMEVAHDVGVRTRARALSISKRAKKRKVSSSRESRLLSTTSLTKLRSSLQRPASHASPCCSSNACSDDAVRVSPKVVDLEDAGFQIETSTCNFGNLGRRETTPSSEEQAESGDMESMARPTEANSASTAGMPSEIELDEFFAASEKNLQKRFTDKYNYDVVNDVPLGGRYEWIQLNP